VRGLAFALLLAAGAANAAPLPGRYEARLCVSTSNGQPASCGPALFELSSGGHAQVRIADIVYRLHLRPAQVDVMTMQGTMEIDEFSASYEWHGSTLTFTDRDKRVRYEVQPGVKARAAY
jgi:hypothetical protein